MIVHLIDGTYELFRQFYGIRRGRGMDPPLGAVAGVLNTVAQMLEAMPRTSASSHGPRHRVVSQRALAGLQDREGSTALWAQFHPLEEALAAMGVAVWPMVELEADDALASAAHLAAADPRVEKVCIWTPDKDLSRCVVGDRVVQVDRKSGKIRDAGGSREVRRRSAAHPTISPWWATRRTDTRACRLRAENGRPADRPPRPLRTFRPGARPKASGALPSRRSRPCGPMRPFRRRGGAAWRGPTPSFGPVAGRIGDARLTARVQGWKSPRPENRLNPGGILRTS
jgi:hypothetical protein